MKCQLTMTCSLSGYQYRTEAERKTRKECMMWAESVKQYLSGMHKPGEPKQFSLQFLYPSGAAKADSEVIL